MGAHERLMSSSGQGVEVPAQHEHVVGAADGLLGRRDGVAGAQLLGLLDEDGRRLDVPGTDGGADVVGAVTDHDHDLGRLGSQRRLQHVPQRGLAADRMQHLRVRGLQPLALAGGQDDRGQRAGACGLALGQRAHFPVGAHMVAAKGWRGKQPRLRGRPFARPDRSVAYAVPVRPR